MNEQDPHLSPEEDLKAENNLLKLKLSLEHGMQMTESDKMDIALENSWLRSVYEFEEQFKNSKRVSVFDYIGSPSYSKIDALEAGEITGALNAVTKVMNEHNIELACICEYPDDVIYKFITEELFHKEIDDIRLPGMTHSFIYEEFYPNHEHDLKERTREFLHAVFNGKWNPDFDIIGLAGEVRLGEGVYARTTISDIVIIFQDAHDFLRLKHFEVLEITITDDCNRAVVRGQLSAFGGKEDMVRYEGNYVLDFVREFDYWCVAGVEVPGL